MRRWTGSASRSRCSPLSRCGDHGSSTGRRPPGRSAGSSPSGCCWPPPPVALLALADARLDDDARSGPASLLLAVGVVAYLAALTRGLHLDGLADTADALGVHGGHDDPQARERALAAAKDPAVGAFGVVTLVLVLGLQAAALAVLVADGTAAVAVLAAAVLARAAAALACAPAYPPARSDGLGALVAGAARWHVQLLTVAVMVVVLVVAAAVTGGDEAFPLVAAPAVAVPVVAQTLLRRCTRRLGGVTGDVLGAVVETATTTALVAAAVVALV